MSGVSSVNIALLYKALKSLDITALVNSWNKAQDATEAPYELATELGGSTARIHRGAINITLEVNHLPLPGSHFADVLAGAPDRAQLANMIAGHRHHIAIKITGAGRDALLSLARHFTTEICTLCPPETIHWGPAKRLFLPELFFETDQHHESHARFLMRPAMAGKGVTLRGARDALGHGVRVLASDLPFEVAESLAFTIADRCLTGWLPDEGAMIALDAFGTTYLIRTATSSDGVLCLRHDAARPAEAAATQARAERKRVTKLALVMARAGETISGLNGKSDTVQKDIDALPETRKPRQAKRARSADEEALRDVFRPGGLSINLRK